MYRAGRVTQQKVSGCDCTHPKRAVTTDVSDLFPLPINGHIHLNVVVGISSRDGRGPARGRSYMNSDHKESVLVFDSLTSTMQSLPTEPHIARAVVTESTEQRGVAYPVTQTIRVVEEE